MKAVLVLAAVLGLASGRLKGHVAGGFRDNIGFSCTGREYGYYADVENQCRYYHICEPVFDENGQLVEEAHYTFLCGLDTRFDQQLLACAHSDVSFPCADAPNMYDASNLQMRLAEEEAKERAREKAKARAGVVQEFQQVSEQV